jgi:hypothetical protein
VRHTSTADTTETYEAAQPRGHEGQDHVTSEKTIVKRDNRRCINEDETRNLMRNNRKTRKTILNPGGMDIRALVQEVRDRSKCSSAYFPYHLFAYTAFLTISLSRTHCNLVSTAIPHEDHRSHGTYRLHHGLAGDLS